MDIKRPKKQTKPAPAEELSPEQAPEPSQQPAGETQAEAVPQPAEAAEAEPAAQPKPTKSRVRRWTETGIIVLLLAAGAFAFGYFHRPASQPSGAIVSRHPKPTPTPTPALPADLLTGQPDAPAVAARPNTAVVIENYYDARPQSGLSQADVVYEALAEGGITRYMAVFHTQQPALLGPVRSVRTYFVDWSLENDAPLAHVGGNADALDEIGPLGMKNMDEFTNGAYFYRTSDRVAPHNMYTTSALLAKLEQTLGYYKPSAAQPLAQFKDDQPDKQAPHPTIDINYSYNGFQVEYRYYPATNTYLRFLAGQPDVDRSTGQQIRVKNVVAEMMPTSYGTTRIGEQTVIMQTVGTGQCVVFRDGDAVVGTWKKDSHGARTQLLDANSQPIALDRGNTWFAVIPIDNQKRLSY